MNKAELIDIIAKAAGITKGQGEKAVNAVFEGIARSLKKGDDARFVGFGTFTVAKRAARNGRNPRTGAPIKISASKVVRFRVGKELKASIN